MFYLVMHRISLYIVFYYIYYEMWMHETFLTKSKFAVISCKVNPRIVQIVMLQQSRIQEMMSISMFLQDYLNHQAWAQIFTFLFSILIRSLVFHLINIHEHFALSILESNLSFFVSSNLSMMQQMVRSLMRKQRNLSFSRKDVSKSHPRMLTWKRWLCWFLTLLYLPL